MKRNTQKRALVSVTDKRELEKLSILVRLGWEIISTDGTARKLTELGIPHISVQDVTGFPEMLDGRLKTLDPRLFGGTLAIRDSLEHMEAIELHGIYPIDLVIVNLYDFKSKPGIEKIDIGGPSHVRAAAKNGKFVTIVVDPSDYDQVLAEILEQGDTSLALREKLTAKAFAHTAEYDKMISEWMSKKLAAGESLFEATPDGASH